MLSYSSHPIGLNTIMDCLQILQSEVCYFRVFVVYHKWPCLLKTIPSIASTPCNVQACTRVNDAPLRPLFARLRPSSYSSGDRHPQESRGVRLFANSDAFRLEETTTLKKAFDGLRRPSTACLAVLGCDRTGLWLQASHMPSKDKARAIADRLLPV